MKPIPLVPILPPDCRALPRLPPLGRRIRWPGDDREWMWDGERWVGLARRFDGGDAWREQEDQEEAA